MIPVNLKTDFKNCFWMVNQEESANNDRYKIIIFNSVLNYFEIILIIFIYKIKQQNNLFVIKQYFKLNMLGE